MTASASILYLGTLSGTCLDRAQAYRRLGHKVMHIDPRAYLPRSVWTDRAAWHLGGHLFLPWIKAGLARTLADAPAFDFCHVDCGEWTTADLVRWLQKRAGPVINYCLDDPTGPRDGRRFHAYRDAAGSFDMLFVMREANIPEVKALGAQRVRRLFMAADEISHAPRPLSEQDRARWGSDVLFLGSWMPERGPFLKTLIERGVPLTIRGAHWHKAPEWPMLRPFWKGGAIAGDDYARAIQCASIALGMLSKGNRDLHTTRSLEIPSLGGLLCAEHTADHEAMYAKGQEAVFWRDAEECAALCKDLLANDAALRAMAQAGRQRLHRNGHLNEILLRGIVDEVRRL